MRRCPNSKAIARISQVHRFHCFLHHWSSSPASNWSGGHRLLKSAALPRIKQMDSLWNRRLMVMPSSSPECLAKALPSFFISAMAEECQAPRLSTAIGMNTMPWRWQASQDLSSFLLCATESACPGVLAASLTSESCSGFHKLLFWVPFFFAAESPYWVPIS